MRLFPLGIGTRLALIIVVFSLATIVAVAFTAYRALNEDFESILTDQQAYEAERTASQVNQSLQERLSLLKAFSYALTDGNNLLTTQKIEELLGRQATLWQLFSNGLLVLDENATAIAENVFVPGRLGTNYADRPHFARAMSTRQPVISRPIIGRTTGVPLLSFIAPIESDAGDLLGFLAGSINLNKSNLIPDQALKISRRQRAELLVIDTDNFLYVESDSQKASDDVQPLPPPGEDPLIDAALSGMGLGEVIRSDGEPAIFATSHLERLGWLFVRVIPKERANAPAVQSFNDFLLISVLIILVMVPLSYLVTRSAMTPLDTMARRIREMSSSGSTASRVDETGPPEVKELAQAFNQLQDERNAISQMQEDFMSNVSHELRTPLTSLNGALRLLSSGTLGALPEKAENMSTLALRNGERLQLLITDLLDFNKLTAGEMQISLTCQFLAPLVSQTIQENQAIAQEHSVVLTGDCPRDVMIRTDGHRLRQILDNFINNAIKFSPPNGTVRVEASRPSPERVRVTVSDQGSGFPEHFKPRLFRRFAQAEAGTTRAAQGTGLGLAICRELTVLLKGQIGAYNDGGAHFWVEFPIEDGKEAS